jgi:hypothetical protein
LTLLRTSDALLALTRLGLGNTGGVLPDSIDWTIIKNLAEQHGLSAVVLDGIERLPDSERPSKEFMLQWIGEVLQNYEYRYELYRRAIAELAGFYREHDLKMMILKGYACSLDWPKPEHRPCGDIDIWLFGKQKAADAILLAEKDIKIDTSEHHHTVFYWKEFMVENHYDFLNVYQHKSSAEMEKVFKELGKDDSCFIELYGERIYLPSVNLHALFLLRHSMCHFAAESITLRQLLDWAFFVKKHSSEIDWKWLEGVIEQYGMKRLYDVYNAICVGDLGFDVNLFPRVQFDPSLKDRVLQEILFPKYPINNLPGNVFKRISFKIRRWKDSAWKNRLCYKESLWSSFWSGVWMHFLKPSQI